MPAIKNDIISYPLTIFKPIVFFRYAEKMTLEEEFRRIYCMYFWQKSQWEFMNSPRRSPQKLIHAAGNEGSHAYFIHFPGLISAAQFGERTAFLSQDVGSEMNVLVAGLHSDAT